MSLLKALLLVVLLAFLTPKILVLIRFFGFHKTVYKHTPGECKRLPGIEHGLEDMQTLSNGITFISSGYRDQGNLNKPQYADHKAEISLIDFNHLDNGVTPLPIEGYISPDSANYHGLSVWENKNTGDILLYIINHLKEKSVIEKFRYDDKRKILIHLSTISDPAFRYMNDLVVLEEDTFYYTNYLYYRGTLELWLQQSWGSVGLYRDGRAVDVVTGMQTPNGINISPDHKYVYVAHLVFMEILVYERKDDDSLVHIQSVPVSVIPDNIDIEPDTGHLWVTGQILGHRAKANLHDYNEVSPSQVMRLKVANGRVSDVTSIYVDDGHLISGGSVAIYRSGKMLMGSVARYAVICDVHYLP